MLWSRGGKCGICVYQALISPDGTTLTAVAMQFLPGKHRAPGYRQ